MKFKNKIYLDYDDIESMNQNLVHDVSKFKPDIIVGITRGGLLPALGAREIEQEGVEASEGEHRVALGEVF